MKFFTSIWMVIIVAIVLLGVRVNNNDSVKTLRYKTWDYFQTIHPRQDISDLITIVNIGEKDIATAYKIQKINIDKAKAEGKKEVGKKAFYNNMRPMMCWMAESLNEINWDDRLDHRSVDADSSRQGAGGVRVPLTRK